MKIVGGILAGGRGRRMPGLDKPLAPLAGRPLIAHVIDCLAPQTEAILINANGDPERFAAFGLDVVADRIEGYRGPLAGVHALLLAAGERGASHVLVVPADTPFLPRDLARRLCEATADPDTVRLACSGGRRHPVVALWPAALAAGLGRHLAAAEDLSMAAYFRDVPVTEVDFSHPGGPDPFFNVNAPADLDAAERLISGING